MIAINGTSTRLPVGATLSGKVHEAGNIHDFFANLINN